MLTGKGHNAGSSEAMYDLSCDSENFAFNAGEELVYKIYYNLNFIWIPAGEVTFRVEEKQHHYIFRAYGKTYASYEWFFKVNDTYETIVDKSTLLPVKAIRELSEGGYQLYEEVSFDQDNQLADVIRGRELEVADDRGSFTFDRCANDVLGVLYKLRNIDKSSFIANGGMPVNFFMDMKTFNIDLDYVESERKKIKGMGKFNTLKISPTLIAGEVFSEGDRMVAWVSDDQNTIPLLLQSPLSVGSAKVVLKSYKNLRYPLKGVE